MPLSAIQPIKTRFKRDQVIQSLTELARRLGPGARMPRVRQMAQSLGVTIATLDQALRELEARGMIIRKDRSGIFVAAQIEQGRIGVVLGSDLLDATATSFRALLLQHCRHLSVESGRSFSFFIDLGLPLDTEEGIPVPYELQEALVSRRLAGVLTISPRAAQEEWLRQHDLPVVSLGRDAAWPHRVVLHGEELIRLAAQELVRQGCREIGLLAANAPHAEMFRRVMNSLDLPIQESWIEIATGHSREEGGIQAAGSLLDRHGVTRRWTRKNSLPQALIITDDVMARGACSVFSQRGITPGQQLRIASHGNRGSWALAEWEDTLTICEYDPQEIIDAMFSMLEKLIEGSPVSDEPVYILPRLKQ